MDANDSERSKQLGIRKLIHMFSIQLNIHILKDLTNICLSIQRVGVIPYQGVPSIGSMVQIPVTWGEAEFLLTHGKQVAPSPAWCECQLGTRLSASISEREGNRNNFREHSLERKYP